MVLDLVIKLILANFLLKIRIWFYKINRLPPNVVETKLDKVGQNRPPLFSQFLTQRRPECSDPV